MNAKPRRERFEKDLHPKYLVVYRALCGELAPHWQPYYGHRALIEQEALWMQGRVLPGPKVTNAKAGESAHNWGCATDWTVFDERGKPHWPPLSDSIWSEYRDAVEKVGLVWGGDFKSIKDGPHNELRIKAPWSMVMHHYQMRGEQAARDFIASMI